MRFRIDVGINRSDLLIKMGQPPIHIERYPVEFEPSDLGEWAEYANSWPEEYAKKIAIGAARAEYPKAPITVMAVWSLPDNPEDDEYTGIHGKGFNSEINGGVHGQ